jgi:non-ribosomal peptide synthetase component E (peptide arylation enzyme)
MDITLQLPDELVQQAQAAGFLTSEKLAELLRSELNRYQHRKALLVDMQHLKHREPSVAADEIEAEIQAFRQERAADRGASAGL